MKIYFLQERPERKKKRAMTEGIPFRSLKRMFDYVESNNIDLGITRMTFYHYYTKFELIPLEGVVIYENDYCRIKQYEV
jgi:hypothetical protein